MINAFRFFITLVIVLLLQTVTGGWHLQLNSTVNKKYTSPFIPSQRKGLLLLLLSTFSDFFHPHKKSKWIKKGNFFSKTKPLDSRTLCTVSSLSPLIHISPFCLLWSHTQNSRMWWRKWENNRMKPEGVASLIPLHCHLPHLSWEHCNGLQLASLPPALFSGSPIHFLGSYHSCCFKNMHNWSWDSPHTQCSIYVKWVSQRITNAKKLMQELTPMHTISLRAEKRDLSVSLMCKG